MAKTVHADNAVCSAHKNMLTKLEFWTVASLLGGALAVGWSKIPSVDRVDALEKDQNKIYIMLQRLDEKTDKILYRSIAK